jgi:cob(I)alamin adenosyltransferase
MEDSSNGGEWIAGGRTMTNEGAENGLGLVHLYTGDGKGKTTAALGLALRVMGQGFKVLIVQFLKTPGFYSECRSAERLDKLTIVSTARSCLVYEKEAKPEDFDKAREGLRIACEAMRSGEYGLVVLDEINIAVKWELLSVDDVLEAVFARREGVEVVLTGRYAPPEFYDLADYVTEMKCIRHPYERGVLSRSGIDK